MKLKHLIVLFFLICLFTNSLAQSDSTVVRYTYGADIVDKVDSTITYNPINLEIENIDTFLVKIVQIEVVHDSTQTIVNRVSFDLNNSDITWNSDDLIKEIGLYSRQDYTLNLSLLNYGLVEIYSNQTTLTDD